MNTFNRSAKVLMAQFACWSRHSVHTAPALVLAAGRSLLGAVLIGVLASPSLVAANTTEAKLAVSATIMKHASLKVLAQPTSVVVTAADVARGYVDVSSPAQFAIQNNSQSGYLLTFAAEGEFMRQTLVRGLGNDVQLDGAGGGVARSADGAGMAKTTLALMFRFVLSESAKQGVYAWPVSLSVAAL